MRKKRLNIIPGGRWGLVIITSNYLKQAISVYLVVSHRWRDSVNLNEWASVQVPTDNTVYGIKLTVVRALLVLMHVFSLR